MRLQELCFDPVGNGTDWRDPLYEVILWGTEPLHHLARDLVIEIQNFYDSECPEESEDLRFLGYEIRHHIQDLEETLKRFSCEISTYLAKKTTK